VCAERGDVPRGVPAHRIGVIDTGLARDQAHAALDTAQAHRFPRHAETSLDFGADRYPFDVTAKRLRQEEVALVPAIETHAFTQQAGRYADADRRLRKTSCLRSLSQPSSWL
jgi:hypothetical protein